MRHWMIFLKIGNNEAVLSRTFNIVIYKYIVLIVQLKTAFFIFLLLAVSKVVEKTVIRNKKAISKL